MRYMGGKARQAGHIREVVARMRGERDHYLEPFMGGGWVSAAVAPDFPRATLADASGPLVALWRAVVVDGWAPPAAMTRDEYDRLRAEDDVTALHGWAGYAASYQGKYFGGYNGDVPSRDYIAEAARSTARKAAVLRTHPDLTILHADYRVHAVTDRTVVYCDPPYADTTGYGAVGVFDTMEFWTTAQKWGESGALVLVHEYSAPDGWVPVLETDRVETMHHGGPSSGTRKEILYMWGE